MPFVEADFWIELAHIEAEVVLINNVLWLGVCGNVAKSDTVSYLTV